MRHARRLALVLLSLAVGLAGLELCVRGLLFSDSALARRHGAAFREPWRYADGDTDEYWALDHRLKRRERWEGALRDAELGWLSRRIEPRTYAHADAASVGERTPVLLFGDSFAHCTTPPEDCFEGLFERSELSARHALLNHGVGGYGLGQIYLLMRAVLPRFEDAAPIVVFSLLIDDDLDRTVLSMRGWVKPRPRLTGGQLAFDPPHPGSLEPWLAEQPALRSYAVRRWLYGSRLVPGALRERWTGRAQRRAEKQALCAAILRAARDELERRQLRYFVLVFHGTAALASPVYGWQEPFLHATLSELGMPFVSSRRELEAELKSGVPADELFDAAQARHLSARGNAVVFQTLRRGLTGDLDG